MLKEDVSGMSKTLSAVLIVLILVVAVFVVGGIVQDKLGVTGYHSVVVSKTPSYIAQYNPKAEGIKTVIKDYSGMGNKGECSVPSCPAGVYENDVLVFEFDGVNDFATIKTVFPNATTKSYTKSAWIKLDDSGGVKHILSGDNVNNHEFYVENGILKASQSGVTISDSEPLSLNEWHFVAVVYSKFHKEIALFKDGEEIGFIKDTVLPPANLGESFIGAFNKNLGFFKGRMADIRIYTQPMTNEEIEGVYEDNDFSSEKFKCEEKGFNRLDSGERDSHGSYYGPFDLSCCGDEGEEFVAPGEGETRCCRYSDSILSGGVCVRNDGRMNNKYLKMTATYNYDWETDTESVTCGEIQPIPLNPETHHVTDDLNQPEEGYIAKIEHSAGEYSFVFNFPVLMYYDVDVNTESLGFPCYGGASKIIISKDGVEQCSKSIGGLCYEN